MYYDETPERVSSRTVIGQVGHTYLTREGRGLKMGFYSIKYAVTCDRNDNRSRAQERNDHTSYHLQKIIDLQNRMVSGNC